MTESSVVRPPVLAGATMPTAYRLYKLRGGQIAEPAVVIERADDQEAIEKAKQHLDGLAIDIWCGARRVTRLEPR